MNRVPPKIKAPRNRLWAGLWLIGLAGLASVVAVVFFLNPATHQFYPVCHFHQLTGLNCPGCGMTRSLHALLHGEFVIALRDNALLVGGLTLVALRAGWLGVNKLRGRPTGGFLPVWILWPLCAGVFIFTVLRNLPAFAFLSP